MQHEVNRTLVGGSLRGGLASDWISRNRNGAISGADSLTLPVYTQKINFQLVFMEPEAASSTLPLSPDVQTLETRA